MWVRAILKKVLKPIQFSNGLRIDNPLRYHIARGRMFAQRLPRWVYPLSFAVLGCVLSAGLYSLGITDLMPVHPGVTIAFLIAGLALAGAATGAALTGGAAWAISLGLIAGQLVGQLLFGEETNRTVEGPRLDDREFPGAGQGQAAARIWGTDVVTAGWMWIKDNELEEEVITKEISSGGGFLGGLFGGGSTTTQKEYKYYMSAALLVCDNRVHGPGQGPLKVWLAEELIANYEVEGPGNTDSELEFQGIRSAEDWFNSATTLGAGQQKASSRVRFVKGDYDQLPDRMLIQAFGDEAPAWRGLAMLYLDRIEVTSFGGFPNVRVKWCNTGSDSQFSQPINNDTLGESFFNGLISDGGDKAFRVKSDPGDDSIAWIIGRANVADAPTDNRQEFFIGKLSIFDGRLLNYTFIENLKIERLLPLPNTNVPEIIVPDYGAGDSENPEELEFIGFLGVTDFVVDGNRLWLPGTFYDAKNDDTFMSVIQVSKDLGTIIPMGQAGAPTLQNPSTRGFATRMSQSGDLIMVVDDNLHGMTIFPDEDRALAVYNYVGLSSSGYDWSVLSDGTVIRLDDASGPQSAREWLIQRPSLEFGSGSFGTFDQNFETIVSKNIGNHPSDFPDGLGPERWEVDESRGIIYTDIGVYDLDDLSLIKKVNFGRVSDDTDAVTRVGPDIRMLDADEPLIWVFGNRTQTIDTVFYEQDRDTYEIYEVGRLEATQGVNVDEGTFRRTPNFGAFSPQYGAGITSGGDEENSPIIYKLELRAPNKVNVSKIIQDLNEIAGRKLSQTDTDSITQQARGLTVKGTGKKPKAVLERIRQHFDIDATQVGLALKFFPLPFSPVATLDQDDLGAGSDGPADWDIEEARGEGVSLPRQIDFAFPDAASATYDEGVVTSRRLADAVPFTSRRAKRETPFVETTQNMARIAERVVRHIYTRGTQVTINTNWRYPELHPGLVIRVPTRDGFNLLIRVESITEGKVVRIVGTPASSDFVSTLPATPANRYVPQLESGLTQTILYLVDAHQPYPGKRLGTRDVPAVIFPNNPNVSYDGAEIFWSTDGRIWNTLGIFTTTARVANAEGALASLSEAEQARTWDEQSEITLNFDDPDYQFPSQTEEQSYREAPVTLYWQASQADNDNEWEIVYPTGAISTEGSPGAGRWNIGGKRSNEMALARGQMGTEFLTGDHTAGEVVIVFDQEAFFTLSQNALKLDESVALAGVTLGQTIGESLVDIRTVGQRRFRPFSVTKIEGTRDGSNNLTISWIYRSRVGRGVWDFPNSGGLERYPDPPNAKVEIVDNTGSPVGDILRTIEVSDASEASYTAAEQTADGITPGDPVQVRIYQIGEFGEEGAGDTIDGVKTLKTV